jgi:hypothetical protein
MSSRSENRPGAFRPRACYLTFRVWQMCIAHQRNTIIVIIAHINGFGQEKMVTHINSIMKQTRTQYNNNNNSQHKLVTICTFNSSRGVVRKLCLLHMYVIMHSKVVYRINAGDWQQNTCIRTRILTLVNINVLEIRYFCYFLDRRGRRDRCPVRS